MTHNILLIQVDQMHASCLSLLGHPSLRTPSLDRLARQGVLYANATANNPICMPSRVSMLSGQYCSTLKQYGFSGLCDVRAPWLQGALKRAGFRTGAFGKLHTLCIGQEQWDFDVAAPTLPEDNDLARPSGHHYMAYCQQQGVTWPTDQMHGHNPFGRAPGIPASARPDMNWARQRSCKSEVPLEHSLETWTTNRCLDFLKVPETQGRPFFVWLTYDRPHSPTTLPDPWFSQVRPDRVNLQPLPTAEQLTRLPPSWFHDMSHNASRFLMGEEDFRFTLATYFKSIEWIDAEVGRVLDCLESLGVADRTTTVFTSDHGDEAGWHGLYDKGRGLSSGAITAVPLIVRPAPALKALEPGRIVREPVELVDLAPTLCSLAGVPIPERMEGQNLSASVLKARPLDPHRAVFCEDYWNRMIARDGWKLVFDMCHETENALFDTTADPQTFANLYDEPAHRERRLDLKRLLLGFVMERLYGPYTQADVGRVERGLDDTDPTLSPIILTTPDGLQFYRSAVVLNDDKHVLLVPFYDKAMLLFELARQKHLYLKRKDAVAFRPETAEPIMDRALRDSFRHMTSVALFVTEKFHGWRCDHPRPTLQQAQALLAKAKRSRPE